MTHQDWLTVGVIIATIIGPCLPIWLQAKLTVQSPTAPEAAHPQIAERKPSRFQQIITSRWVCPPLFVGLNIFMLVREVRKPFAPTALEVMNISLFVGGAFYNLMWFMLLSLQETVHLQGRVTLDGFKVIRDGVRQLKESLADGMVKQKQQKRGKK